MVLVAPGEGRRLTVHWLVPRPTTFWECSYLMQGGHSSVDMVPISLSTYQISFFFFHFSSFLMLSP